LTGQPIAYNLSKLISNKWRMEAMPEKTSKAINALYNNELLVQDTLSSQIKTKVAIQNGIDKRPTRISAAASPTTKKLVRVLSFLKQAKAAMTRELPRIARMATRPLTVHQDTSSTRFILFKD